MTVANDLTTTTCTKLQQRFGICKQLILTTLLSTIQKLTKKRANKTTRWHCVKKTQIMLNDAKPDANGVWNISSGPLDETETHQVLSY